MDDLYRGLGFSIIRKGLNGYSDTISPTIKKLKQLSLIIQDMPKRESYYIYSEGASTDSVRKAFEWLINYPSKRGFIAVMGYGNLKGVITEVLGHAAVRTLTTKGSLMLSGKEILLVTERKPIYTGRGLPMVVFFPTPSFLDKMDSIPDVKAMLVVPWNMKEIEPWIRTWNATELGKQKKPTESLVRSKVVEQALRFLTSSVNVSTGITHPSDRRMAIEIFEILRDAGEDFAPEEVKAWLIAEGGWKATDAQKVAEVAKQVLARKKLRKGPRILKENILIEWRRAASEETKREEENQDDFKD